MAAASMASQLKMETRWISRREVGSRVPIFISTSPSLINLHHLQDLYGKCNHSCHRFPLLDSNGKALEAVDLKKLRVALSHSSILVSVFCNSREQGDRPLMGLPLPFVSPADAQLVGFGRAVSDLGLTAAIYDVMVLPSLQRLGIGKLIVSRIIRMLTSRDIYDISALCSANERLFFEACGFGDDILGSTMMMYTRTASVDSEGEQAFTHAGRKCLLIPPLSFKIPSEP